MQDTVSRSDEVEWKEETGSEREVQDQAAWSSMRRTTFSASLEGLRGMAALMVVLSHTGNSYMSGFAGMGVHMFFTLSGYLITGTLVKSHNKHQNLLHFYVARLARLWPPVILCLLTCVYITSSQGVPWSKISPLIWQSGFYLSDFYIAEHTGSFVAHFWSLAIEEQFYCVWPIFVPLILKRKKSVQSAIVFGLTVSSVLYRRYLFAHGMVLYAWKGFGANLWGLLLGAVLRFVSLPSWILSSLTCYFGFLILIGCYAVSFVPRNGVDVDVVSSIATVLVIIGTSVNENILLSTQALRFLGRVSYSWYLFHLPLLALYKVRGRNDAFAWALSTSALVIATISTLYLEEPLRNFVRARFDARKSRNEYTHLPVDRSDVENMGQRAL